MNQKNIAILGLPGSGKTTFLGVLNLGLALNSSRWRIRPIGQSIKAMANITTYLFSKGFFPPKTDEETNLEFVCEKEAQYLGLIPGAQFKISIPDILGEATEGKTSEYYRLHDFYPNLVRGSLGIIFLIDPEEIWLKTVKSEENGHAYYFSLISNIFTEIQEDISEIPIAFCITKADALKSKPDDFSRSTRSDGIEYLAENILGKGTKSLIDHVILPDYLLWTLVSSIGLDCKITKREDKLGNEINKIYDPKNLKPIGVAETLEWLLDKMAQQDEDTRISRTRGKAYAKGINAIRKIVGR